MTFKFKYVSTIHYPLRNMSLPQSKRKFIIVSRQNSLFCFQNTIWDTEYSHTVIHFENRFWFINKSIKLIFVVSVM